MAIQALPFKRVIRRSLAENLLGCPAFLMEEGGALAFGQAFHTFAAGYLLHCKALGEETDLTAVYELGRDAWARTRGLDQSRDGEFLELCQTFADRHLAGLPALEAVEKTITHDVGWALLTCTLDGIWRIDGGDPDDEPSWLLVRDWKTEQGEMEHGFQIRWYVQMLFLTMPALDSVDFEVDPVRRARPYDVITFNRGELDTWWAMTMQALREVIESPVRTPYGGMHCRDCKLRRTCANAVEPHRQRPETEQEADAALERWHRLDAAAKTEWAGLKTFYDGRDFRVVRGEEVGFMPPRKPSTKLKPVAGIRDAVKVAKAAKKAGVAELVHIGVKVDDRVKAWRALEAAELTVTELGPAEMRVRAALTRPEPTEEEIA